MECRYLFEMLISFPFDKMEVSRELRPYYELDKKFKIYGRLLKKFVENNSQH
jgi:hypothetical protein